MMNYAQGYGQMANRTGGNRQWLEDEDRLNQPLQNAVLGSQAPEQPQTLYPQAQQQTSTPRTPTAPTGLQGLYNSPTANQDIRGLYSKHLGTSRNVSDEEVQGHLGNPGGLSGIEQAILKSPEYAQRQSQMSNIMGQLENDPNAANAVMGGLYQRQPLPALSSGLGGQNLQWSGFNMGRAQDPTKSAKDTFLHYGSNASWMPQTKEDAARWFNEFAKPGLEAQGYRVHAVEGDKAFVSTMENPEGEWIDFLINAGGTNPQLGWQSDKAGTSSGTPFMPGFGEPDYDALSKSILGGDVDSLAQILASIQATQAQALGLTPEEFEAQYQEWKISQASGKQQYWPPELVQLFQARLAAGG